MDTVTSASSQYIGFISKWTLDDACLWVKPVSTSPISTTVFALTIDPQGQLMLAGVTGDLGPTQVGNEVLPPGSFLARCDTDGNVLWAKQLMTYGMQQPMFDIYSLRNIGQDVVGYGKAYMFSEQDTIRVDDQYFTGGSGSALGLVRISTSNGQAQWLTLAGYPGAILGPSASARIAIGPAGDIMCIGPWYGSAVFATDTLVDTGSGVQSFIARFDGSGIETDLLDLRPGSGELLSLNSVYIDSAGFQLLAVALAGSVDLCGSQLSSVGWGSILMRLDPSGNCMIIDQTGAGVHATAIGTDHGIYAIGGFPAEGPTGSTTIGTTTYTTHGWSDIIFAKHDLPTSIAPKSAGDDRLLIHANPNQGSFRLVLPEAVRHAQNLVLRVYYGTGRLLHQQKLHRNEERPKVDVWNVRPGFYMVTVSDGKRTYSGNMVVE
jgi:hypothetical protein